MNFYCAVLPAFISESLVEQCSPSGLTQTIVDFTDAGNMLSPLGGFAYFCSDRCLGVI